MPHADVQPLGMVHSAPEPEHVSRLSRGLADTHKDDVADILAAVQLGEQHLIQDLRGPQIRTFPPRVEAQKAQPMRQPTWLETHTVLPWW